MPAAHRFVVAIRNRQQNRVLVVRRRAENVARGADAQAPGVVAGLSETFEVGAIGPKAEKSLAKPMLDAAGQYRAAVVADRAVNPIVEAVVQIRDRAVRVAAAEAGENDLANVGLPNRFVVRRVAVFEQQEYAAQAETSTPPSIGSRLVGIFSLSAKR